MSARRESVGTTAAKLWVVSLAMNRLHTMRKTWRKLSTRLATPSPLQSMQEVLSSTTKRESTTILSALKENLTTLSCLLDTTKLLLSPTGLSKTPGERTGARTDTSTSRWARMSADWPNVPSTQSWTSTCSNNYVTHEHFTVFDFK